jgi:hypothetical protein
MIDYAPHLGTLGSSGALNAGWIRHWLTTAHEDANTLAVPLLDANPRGLVVAGMNEHYVRCIDITFGFHDTAFASATATRAKMSLLETDAFDAHAALLDIH